MGVDVVIEEPLWAKAGLEDLAERAVGAVLNALELARDDWDVAVLGCDDARIAALNAEFRGKAVPTNVLSWPSEERGAAIEGETPDLPGEPGELGDLAISYETCLREAELGGKPLRHHALHLLVHGTLHLLGYDHVREGDGDLMERTEIAILERLGVPDPYGDDGAASLMDDGKD